ncbi:MAG TPA: ERAP1-like C-terminal domain-containing protein, partial [Candidatus Saccharimonadia bacterium]|nr:ERAP1-like C-terminal domain-containing protein [Candidatus Saccharimonadia bacterium]
TRYFTDFTHDRPLDPDLRAVALFAAARHGGEAEFTMMLKRYREESSPQVKIGLLGAMGSFRKIGLIKRYLDSGLSPDVRPQDIYIVLSQMFGNRSGRNQAWTWMKMHWDELTNRYGAGGHMLERFPLYVAHGFSTRAMAAEVSEFFSLHPHPATVRPTAQALEMIEAKADWFERDGDGIAEFLDAWKRTSGEGRRLKD